MSVKVREKRPGEWWVFIDHRGQRKAKKIGNEKTAREVAKKIEARLVLGDCGFVTDETKKVSTFGEYAEKWIAVTVPATCSYSTGFSYRGLLKNYVLPVFGKTPVNEISRMAIKTFLMKKSQATHAASTTCHMKSVISGVLNMAVDDGVIPANPIHKIGKLFRMKQINEEINPLTREELTILLDAVQKHFPRHYAMVLTLARTGMRIGEVTALQWGDIDFNGRFITVQRGFSRNRLNKPKSGKSRRVDMSLQLTETLKSLRQERRIEAMRKGWGQVPDWVFITETGTPTDAGNWKKKVFDKALEKAGLRKIRVHDLRHTTASLLIQAGESLVYVKDQLGHSSIKLTVDVYSHLMPGGNKSAVDRLDDATIRNPYATNQESPIAGAV